MCSFKIGKWMNKKGFPHTVLALILWLIWRWSDCEKWVHAAQIHIILTPAKKANIILECRRFSWFLYLIDMCLYTGREYWHTHIVWNILYIIARFLVTRIVFHINFHFLLHISHTQAYHVLPLVSMTYQKILGPK